LKYRKWEITDLLFDALREKGQIKTIFGSLKSMLRIFMLLSITAQAPAIYDPDCT